MFHAFITSFAFAVLIFIFCVKSVLFEMAVYVRIVFIKSGGKIATNI